MRMQVNLNKLYEFLSYIDEINKEDLDNIDWIIDGEEITPPHGAMEQWKYIGLNNTEFARSYLPLREAE